MKQALYVVSKAGHPLYFYEFDRVHDQDIEDATLFSGMISAIQGFLREINVGEVSSFSTDKNEIYIKSLKDMVYVLVIDGSAKISPMEVQDLLERYIDRVKISYSHDKPFSLSHNENQLLDKVVEMTYDGWQSRTKETAAAKKMRDSLW